LLDFDRQVDGRSPQTSTAADRRNTHAADGAVANDGHRRGLLNTPSHESGLAQAVDMRAGPSQLSYIADLRFMTGLAWRLSGTTTRPCRAVTGGSVHPRAMANQRANVSLAVGSY
jgi:hypothetical protein